MTRELIGVGTGLAVAAGERVAGVAGEHAEHVAGSGDDGGDDAADGGGHDLALADADHGQDAEQAGDEAEHGRDEHRGDDAESAQDFLRDGSGLVDGDVVTAGLTDGAAVFEVQILAAVDDADLTVVIELPDGEVVAVALFEDVGNARAHFLVAVAFVVHVSGLAHQELTAGGDLRAAVLKGVELLLAVGELVAAGREIVFALRELLLSVSELRLTGSDGLLGLGQLDQTVLVLLELRLTVGDHLLDVSRQVGHIVRNDQTHVGRDRTHDGDEPCLGAREAAEVGDGAVAEVHVLVDVGHERLDLGEGRFAFVVSSGVVLDLLLAGGIGGFAFLKLLLAGVVGGVACGELSLAFGVGDQAGGVGVHTGEVRALVLLQLVKAGIERVDGLQTLFGVLFLVLFDIHDVAEAAHSGEQAEDTRSDQADADDRE